MAQKIITVLTDDIDGGEADETVTFSLDGTNYEIDLTNANADKMRGILYDYTAKARKVTGKPGRSSKAKQSGPTAADIRAWATANGYEVTERGRIPADIRAAFEKAN